MSVEIKSKPKVSKKISPYKYEWRVEPDGSFTLRIDQRFKARVYEDKSVWRLVVVMGPKTYRGERDSLEAASKSIDRMIYKKLPGVWTVLDARVIMASWKGNLQL